MSKFTLSKLSPYRKWIILGSFLLLFIGCIIATYVITYTSTKVTPFPQAESIKTISGPSKITDFDFDIYCSQYEKAGSQEKKSMEFTATVENAIEDYSFYDIKFQVALGDRHWTKNYIEGSTTRFSFSSTSPFKSATKLTTKTSTISNYTYSYPIRKLLFIKIDTPTLFVTLTYTKDKQGKKTENSYFFELEYDDYFRSGTTIVG